MTCHVDERRESRSNYDFQYLSSRIGMINDRYPFGTETRKKIVQDAYLKAKCHFQPQIREFLARSLKFAKIPSKI